MPREIRFQAAELPPNTCRAFSVGDHIVMVYNCRGEFFATQGRCPHEDLPLEGGTYQDNVMECPWHGSRFNVTTGKLLTPPAEDNLRTYPTRVEGDTVTVILDAPAPMHT